MSTRRIILARHGQTELNRLGIVQGSGVDPSLNDVGVAQAQALADHFLDTIDLVCHSGMIRAKETVTSFVDAGIPTVVDPRFREICWGKHEGMAATDASKAEYAALMSSWETGDLNACIEGGESALQLADRLAAAWHELSSMPFQSALVCMHGRALRCLTCIIDQQPLTAMNSYEHANAGYYIAELTDGSWKLTVRNQTNHLSALTIS